MKKITLFGHYKGMINKLWAAGQRSYTASQLNTYVGQYERTTLWKRINNNHYYVTRTYQKLLKELGCITMIKRGLWQINGPIPEWFSTFHFEFIGTEGYNQRRLDCMYWQSLPAEHKVNPWKNIDPMRVMASIQPLNLNNPTERAQYINNTKIHNNMKITIDAAFYTVGGLQLSKEIPTLTATYQVNLWQESVGIGWGGEVMETTYYFNNREIAESTAREMITAYADNLTSFDFNSVRKQHNAMAIDAAIQAQVHTEHTSEKTYTKAQVEQILEEYSARLAADIHISSRNFKFDK